MSERPKPYYEDEYVTLYHGDALAVLPELERGSVDLVLTDPPYSSGGMYRSDRSKGTADKYQHSHETNRTYAAFSGDNRDQRSFEKWSALWMSAALNVVREEGALGCFIDWRNIACVVDAVQIGGWVYRGIVPWYKGGDQRPRKAWFRSNVEYIVWGSAGALDAGPETEGICQDGLLFCRMNGFEKEHQTQKPVGLFHAVYEVRPDWATILDPFAGSGSTLRAAKDLGRKAIGIEIEERYCEIAAKRMAQSVLALA